MAKRSSTSCRVPTVNRKWQARSDLDTLRGAAEIKSSPSRTRAAMSEAKAQMAAIAKVRKP